MVKIGSVLLLNSMLLAFSLCPMVMVVLLGPFVAPAV